MQKLLVLIILFWAEFLGGADTDKNNVRIETTVRMILGGADVIRRDVACRVFTVKPRNLGNHPET